MHVIGPKNVLCMPAQYDKSMTSHWLLEDRERRRKKITFLDFICLVETVLWKISKKVIQMEIYHSRRLNENSQILPGQND